MEGGRTYNFEYWDMGYGTVWKVTLFTSDFHYVEMNDDFLQWYT
jgi:hypothetical protein